ncbi:MAG: hypothetical protein ABS78_10105 [Phenylobacterium sp. SCN 70-31]|nr:MAG: hypothetical protein ABS78_10105 [Phenylobacterium sp. SCN 70-31]
MVIDVRQVLYEEFIVPPVRRDTLHFTNAVALDRSGRSDHEEQTALTGMNACEGRAADEVDGIRLDQLLNRPQARNAAT